MYWNQRDMSSHSANEHWERYKTMDTTNALHGKKLAFIGCGTMGEAILATLLNNNMVTADQISGSEPVVERREDLSRRYGIHMTGSNAEAVQDADLIMLTIKPQSLESIAKDLRGKLNPEQVVVSILAGATVASITSGLDHQAVVRAMPNTPSQIGQGMTVWMATPQVSDSQQVEVAAALSAIGFRYGVRAVERIVERAPARVGCVQRIARVGSRHDELRARHASDLVIDVAG